MKHFGPHHNLPLHLTQTSGEGVIVICINTIWLKVIRLYVKSRLCKIAFALDCPEHIKGRPFGIENFYLNRLILLVIMSDYVA